VRFERQRNVKMRLVPVSLTEMQINNLEGNRVLLVPVFVIWDLLQPPHLEGTLVPNQPRPTQYQYPLRVLVLVQWILVSARMLELKSRKSNLTP